ncbi:MAG TPA: hypothetical protein VJZ76_10905 [Thermoanaerobaculia bacterium]|nr:hypothetical protein [Thermoanaerobaculia bacterium]
MYFLLFALSLAAGTSTQSERAQMAADGVRAYAAPELAGAYFYVSGKVSVEVLVGEDGSVTEVRHQACEYERLLLLAEAAARDWKFTPSSAGRRTITFVVEPETWTMEETRVAARYETPLTLRTQLIMSIVLRWPRVDGQPPEKSCAVHHEWMHIETLPIVYSGMPLGHPDGALYDEWEHAFLTGFPNSGESIGMGDAMVLEQFAEAYICNSCQKARREWLAAHHLERPPR